MYITSYIPFEWHCLLSLSLSLPLCHVKNKFYIFSGVLHIWFFGNKNLTQNVTEEKAKKKKKNLHITCACFFTGPVATWYAQSFALFSILHTEKYSRELSLRYGRHQICAFMRCFDLKYLYFLLLHMKHPTFHLQSYDKIRLLCWCSSHFRNLCFRTCVNAEQWNELQKWWRVKQDLASQKYWSSCGILEFPFQPCRIQNLKVQFHIII